MINFSFKNIKLIIFDFDGTIADTKNKYYSSILGFLEDEERAFSKAKLDKFFGLKLHDILEKLGVEGDYTRTKMRILHEVFHDVNSIKIVNLDFIKKIKKKGIRVIIVSNSPTKDIKRVLRHYKKEKYFDKIYGGDKFTTKPELFDKLIKKYGLKKDEVVYIADMVKDIDIAREEGIKIISIISKFAFDPAKKVLKAKPDFVIRNFNSLIKLFN
jgi:phosphoglycolate phosphatase